MGGKRKKKSLSPSKAQISPPVKKGKRNSSSVAVEVMDRNPIQANPYAPLGGAEDFDDDQSSVKTAATPMEHPARRNTTPSKRSSDGPAVIPPPAKTKLPPLVVKSIPLDKLKRTMQAIGINATYQLTGVGIKLIISTMTEYSKAKTYLAKAGAEFFTFDVAAEKPFKVVVRGLPEMDTSDILDELRDDYNLKPLAVFAISRRNRQANYRDCLYLVHFVKGSVTLGALKPVRYLSDCKVEWEAYKGPNRSVTQCMRCLNFGHGTRNCNLKPRCNYCAQDHWTENCAIEGAVEFKCANCAGPHMSTNKRCPKLEQYRNIRKQASTRHQPRQKKTDRENIFDPDSFPELPLPTQRSAPAQAPVGQYGARNPPHGHADGPPPGFRWNQQGLNPRTEPSNNGFQSIPEVVPASVSNTIAHLATLVAEMQKMMMQLMQMFLNSNIHRQGA